jgi:hypothetical protein
MALILASPLIDVFDRMSTSLFDIIVPFIQGEAQDFGMVIFSIGLTLQAILGGAELATGSPEARLVKGTFWFRILMVAGVLLTFDAIFINFSKAVTESALKLISTDVDIFLDRYVLLRSTAESFAKAAETVNGTGFGVIKDASRTTLEQNAAFGQTLVKDIFSTLGLVTAIGLIFGGAATSVLVLCLAPVCIPFAIHEDTQSIAWSYARTWLLYGVMYMPLLTITVKVATEMGTLIANAGLDALNSGKYPPEAWWQILLILALAPWVMGSVIKAMDELLKIALR